MSNADILVFPSLHEGMPTVVIEALSMGIPVICLDHCGQGDAVTSDCGFKIRVTTPKQVVQGFTEAITKIVRNPREIERLSLGALKRSQEFTWEKNAQKMLKVYQQAMMHWNVKVD
jgi:glycosyltransferase involved in cell wall biosynthesis